MSRNKIKDSDELKNFSKEVAVDVHAYYFEENETSSNNHFNKQSKINDILATIANEATKPVTKDRGKITTTQHDEKIIFDISNVQDTYDIGSYGVRLNEIVLETENLPKNERVDKIQNWILNTADRIREDVEQKTEGI